MAQYNKGRMIISANKFKDFIHGRLKDDEDFKNNYNGIDSIESYWINAENLEIRGDLELNSSDSIIYDITLSNCLFINKIDIDDSEFKKLWFLNCVFQKPFVIKNIKIETWLWLSTCTLESGLRIHNGFFKDFSCSNTFLKSPLTIKGGVFDRLSLSPSRDSENVEILGEFTLIDYLHITANDIINLSISKSIINIIKFSGIFNSKSIVIIQDIKNYSLFFEKVVNLGKIFLLNIEILNELIQFKNDDIKRVIDEDDLFKDDYEKKDSERIIKKHDIKNVLSFVNNIFITNNFIEKNNAFFKRLIYSSKGKKYENLFIKVEKSTFKIFETTLGIVELKNFNINKFEEIYIDSSDLSELRTLNSKFPTKNGRIKNFKENFNDLYHVYNDLFSIASKQNNLKEKIEYYKASQENLLLATKKESFSFKKLSSLYSLRVSKFYSDYGQNWIRAFIITVFIGLFFYGIYILSLANYKLDLSKDGFNYFNKYLLQYFPQFLNPTHKLSFTDDFGVIGKWSSAIDLFSRVFTGIGIYEIIRSFRKYVRK